jgi:hypothetical protein
MVELKRETGPQGVAWMTLSGAKEKQNPGNQRRYWFARTAGPDGATRAKGDIMTTGLTSSWKRRRNWCQEKQGYKEPGNQRRYWPCAKRRT